MGREVVNESWFGGFRWTNRKGVAESPKDGIGILSIEVAELMSKVVSLWHCLSDKEIERLRDEIATSVGVQKVVSNDVDYLMDLALNEILANFGIAAKSVVTLSRKCAESPFLRFADFVNDPVESSLEWFRWQYRLNKMEKKVRKMERYVAVTAQLVHELDVLAELEQTLRRINANPELARGNLADFRLKVTSQRSGVESLRDMSPWIRTYDYTVRLLARSLVTILERIKVVFGVKEEMSLDGQNDHSLRSQSFSSQSQSSVRPPENIPRGFSSGGNFGRSESMSGNHLAHVGPSKGTLSGHDSSRLSTRKPVVNVDTSSSVDRRRTVEKPDKCIGSSACSGRLHSKLALINSKHELLKAPKSTLGNAALALHYANLVVLIEKLASSPHKLDLETRDELYNMLPTSIRTALRSRLKAYCAAGSLLVYDASLAEEWSVALSGILAWLSPLAHKTIRWQSERNFERECEFSGTALLLVQTLHYANRVKTEAAIIELLVGLNYICRINTKLVQKAGCQRIDQT